eukprot:TRINITY_DN2278_c0_g1_i1.p1 TRINITY_DN2278_c0_g1~~TRINITY_DN2278_c0_g1_i1.p1  ORF type:complete len:148 (-),score=2.16 TRINITY_DN2278_c0_g1_i1:121-564(-)
MKREVKNDMKDTQATTRSQVVLQSIPLPQVSSLRANTPPAPERVPARRQTKAASLKRRSPNNDPLEASSPSVPIPPSPTTPKDSRIIVDFDEKSLSQREPSVMSSLSKRGRLVSELIRTQLFKMSDAERRAARHQPRVLRKRTVDIS